MFVRIIRSLFKVRPLRIDPPSYVVFDLSRVKRSTAAKSHTARTPLWRYTGYDPRNSADRFSPETVSAQKLARFVKRARRNGAL